MPTRVYSAVPRGIEDILNATTVLGPYPAVGLPVGGLTLVFTTPSQTVTFSGGSGDVLGLADIVDEINTAVGDDIATLRQQANRGTTDPYTDRYIALRLDSGFELAETGTANSVFGFSVADPTVNPGAVDRSRIVGFTQGATLGYYTLILED